MSILIVDSMTWTITILGWLIVFAALIFLIGVFLFVPKILRINLNRVFCRTRKDCEEEDLYEEEVQELSGETNAAIATALYMYFNEQHDEESNVITIKEVKKRYSPWSSKVYSFNNVNFPR